MLEKYTKEDAEKLKSLLTGAPIIHVHFSDLCREKTSLMLTIGFTPQDEWVNGIFENSKYARLSMHHNSNLECFTSSKITKKLRACKVVSIEQIAGKINKWIAENS